VAVRSALRASEPNRASSPFKSESNVSAYHIVSSQTSLPNSRANNVVYSGSSPRFPTALNIGAASAAAELRDSMDARMEASFISSSSSFQLLIYDASSTTSSCPASPDLRSGIDARCPDASKHSYSPLFGRFFTGSAGLAGASESVSSLGKGSSTEV
jgi:hypothetical protein